MLEVDIPGFGGIELEYLVSDFTGTLSVNGKLIDGVEERFERISEDLKIYVLTADTFGRAREELKGLPCEVILLSGSEQDVQKEEFVKKLGPERVVAIGNGNNDRRMLKFAKLGIAVIEGEGCSLDALLSANVVVRNINDGLDLLLNPKRLIATLRF